MSTVSGAVSTPAASIEKPTLQRSVTWKSSFVVGLGGSLLIVTSLGAIAADLGPASVFVWTLTVLIGIMQCFMITELASLFPNKSGGTAVYVYEAFKKISPFFGAVANWGYWVAWVPVIPVNLVIAAGYLSSLIPGLSSNSLMTISVIMAFVLYGTNYIGLKPGIWSSAVMAICSICPLMVIVLSPVFHPGLFHWSNILPFTPLGGSWHSGDTWMKMIKWMFVAMWSSYAAECASTTIAELKNPKADAPKAMGATAAAFFISFGIVPFVMLGIVGVSLLSQDAKVAFLPAAQAIFGHIGGVVVSIMLITALLLGVQTTIIGSSRSMYQMTHDGQMIKQFGLINKFGVPVGSMFVDLAVTLALLFIFKANIVSLIAASNVGYVIVFILLVPAYIILSKRYAGTEHAIKLPSFFVPLGVLITLFNVMLLCVGGPQWDATPVATPVIFGHTINFTVMGVGWGLMAMVVPFYFYRTLVQDKGKKDFPDPGLPELSEGDDDLGGRREVIHHEG